jgi:phosphoribosyl 1,2-cyclic phosphodiesterase
MSNVIFKPLASGSGGNCYFLSDGKTNVLLDAGIPIAKIKEKLNFKLSEVDACFVTHEHKDHCKAVPGLTAAGVPCWMTEGTSLDFKTLLVRSMIETMTVTRYYSEPPSWRQMGTFNVAAFETYHDAVDPCAFVLCGEGCNCLYLTDSALFNYHIPRLTHLFVECNYAEADLKRNVAIGKIPQAQKDRVVRSHMGLETLIQLLSGMDRSLLKEVWLLHLSAGNSNEADILSGVKEVVGDNVVVRAAAER